MCTDWQSPLWIGGSKSLFWYWVGETVQIVNYDWWSDDRAIGNGECMQLSLSDVKFIDGDCSAEERFICERDPFI